MRCLLVVLLVVLFVAAFPIVGLGQPVLINEVMSSNGRTIADDDGDFEDWIELHNPGVAPVALAGFTLTDNPSDLMRWVFPDVTLQPGDWLIVWLSGKDRAEGGGLHASFSLSREGETLIIADVGGEPVDELVVPPLPRDVSFGRSPDGSDTWRYFTEPTPGLSNTGPAYGAYLNSPSFSQPAGFYTSSFDLELGTDTDAAIYFTLDGSDPDETSTRYESPIRIQSRQGDPNVLSTIPTSHTYHPWAPPMGEVFKGTVVRAIAVRDDALPSDVTTRSYFVDESIHSRYSVPVISIATDSVHLFSGATGLFVPGDEFEEYIRTNPSSTTVENSYANYAERGEEWERPVHLEVFDDGTTVLSQQAGMRIHGGLSRLYRQKSLRLYARGEYGESDFGYELFPEKPGMISRRVILRASGQDWTKTMMRDAFMQRLVRHMDVDYQAYEPAVVFINGEYWGVHNIRERIDRHYLASNYGVDPDRVDLLTGSGQIKEGSNTAFLTLRSFVQQNDMRQPEHFAHVESQMDVDNFIDYHIAQIFVRNNDWPHNNIDFWRSQPGVFPPDAGKGRDGRWRWVLFDMDFGFGWSADPWDRDMIAWARSSTGNGDGRAWATVLFRNLIVNEDFRDRFVSRLADQLNTAFRPAHVIGLIDEFERRLEPEMAEHIHRWGWRKVSSPYHQNPANLDEWKANVEVLRDFARRRPGYVWTHLGSNFGLERPVGLRVDVSDAGAGYVEVNSIHLTADTPGVDADPFPWHGNYYREVPVRLVAHPAPGYRFAGWDGAETATSDTIHVTVESATSVTAQFVTDDEWLADVFPQPYQLADGSYLLDGWRGDEPAGSFPASMAFYYMDEDDPSLNASPVSPTEGAYDLESRTRIVGLGASGIGFINTSNADGNPGYPGRRLGAAVLALDTRERTEIDVRWTGGTVVPNVREYNLRLQYRLGNAGPLHDLVDESGEVVEYRRSDIRGHAATIGPTRLPRALENRPYVQLWWRYYHTGERSGDDGGARDMLRLADILVSSRTSVGVDEESIAPPVNTTLHPNYPNPFNPTTTIGFDLAAAGPVRLTVYDMLGRRVAVLVDDVRRTGQYEVVWEASSVPSGLYMIRLEHNGTAQTRAATLLK
jgi:hypothetical protein